MTVMTMDFRTQNGEKQRTLGLDKDPKDAVGDYCRERWPSGTAKAVAKFFELNTDDGRSIANYRVSFANFTRILKRGGWKVAIPILTAIIGEPLDQYLARERAIHADQAARLDALASDLWPRRPVSPDRADCVGADAGGRLEPDRRRMGEG